MNSFTLTRRREQCAGYILFRWCYFTYILVLLPQSRECGSDCCIFLWGESLRFFSKVEYCVQLCRADSPFLLLTVIISVASFCVCDSDIGCVACVVSVVGPAASSCCKALWLST